MQKRECLHFHSLVAENVHPTHWGFHLVYLNNPAAKASPLCQILKSLCIWVVVFCKLSLHHLHTLEWQRRLTVSVLSSAFISILIHSKRNKGSVCISLCLIPAPNYLYWAGASEDRHAHTVCSTCSWSTVKLVRALLAGLDTELESFFSATASASFISSFWKDDHRTRVICTFLTKWPYFIQHFHFIFSLLIISLNKPPHHKIRWPSVFQMSNVFV